MIDYDEYGNPRPYRGHHVIVWACFADIIFAIVAVSCIIYLIHR